MKILQVINALLIGGAERLLIDNALLFKEKGIDVEILTLSQSSDNLADELRSAGIKLHSLQQSNYSPKAIVHLRKYLKNYDLVHVHLFPSLYWAAFSKFFFKIKTPLIFTEHSTTNRRRSHFLLKKIDRFVYGLYDRILMISEGVQQAMSESFPRHISKFQLLENGINLKKFKKEPSEKLRFFTEEDFVLVQVSRFSASKDQQTLIRSLSLLPAQVCLVLVGDGERLGECKALVQSLGLDERVEFLGARSDINAILHAVDVGVLSSHHEGFGLAIVEAMAAGLPVVASDIQGVNKIVLGAGLLFEQGNPAALAKQIERLHQEHEFYDEVRAKCIERATGYDIEIMVDKLISLYGAHLR